MARGFNAGERASVLTNSTGSELKERGGADRISKEFNSDTRSTDQILSDARKVSSEFSKALKEYDAALKGRAGFGASEEKPSWFPSKDKLPSSSGSFASSSEAAEADKNKIIESIPDSERSAVSQMITAEYDRQQKNIGNASSNGVNAIVMNRLKEKSPAVYAALKDIAAKKSIARSADLKKQIDETRKSDDKFDDLYSEAWKEANKAFDSADSVAKMALKRGDESYSDTREFISVNGTRTGTKESVSSLSPGEPSVSGRVNAVNIGILIARRAAEDVLNKLEKAYDKIEKKAPGSTGSLPAGAYKNDVLNMITQKLIADKGAFLAVRGYIPPTARYVGPVNGNGNPVEHLSIISGRFPSDINYG